MARKCAAGVGLGDAGLRAENRDELVIEVGGADELGTVAEQVLASLSGLAIGDVRLGRANVLPGIDELTDDGVDRLGECRRRLVRRNVQQTDAVGLAVVWVGGLVPADAFEFESADLVHP